MQNLIFPCFSAMYHILSLSCYLLHSTDLSRIIYPFFLEVPHFLIADLILAPPLIFRKQREWPWRVGARVVTKTIVRFFLKRAELGAGMQFEKCLTHKPLPNSLKQKGREQRRAFRFSRFSYYSFTVKVVLIYMAFDFLKKNIPLHEGMALFFWEWWCVNLYSTWTSRSRD